MSYDVPLNFAQVQDEMTEELKPPEETPESLEKQGIPIEVKRIHPEKEEPVRITDKRYWVKDEGAPEPGPADGKEELAAPGKPAYVEELEKKLQESEKKLDEVVASYRQFKAESAAEIQKIRQRIQTDHNRRLTLANAEMAQKFLVVLENLERAMAASTEIQNLDILQEGIGLICSQFNNALSDLGIEELKVLGHPYHPEAAEAVEMVPVPSEEQDHVVMEVVSKGYRIGEVLVRPARVKVGKFDGKKKDQ
jgi:molecular chaperone GrpE